MGCLVYTQHSFEFNVLLVTYNHDALGSLTYRKMQWFNEIPVCDTNSLIPAYVLSNTSVGAM